MTCGKARHSPNKTGWLKHRSEGGLHKLTSVVFGIKGE